MLWLVVKFFEVAVWILGKIVIPAAVALVLGCMALWQRHKYKQRIRRGESPGENLDQQEDEPSPWRSY